MPRTALQLVLSSEKAQIIDFNRKSIEITVYFIYMVYSRNEGDFPNSPIFEGGWDKNGAEWVQALLQDCKGPMSDNILYIFGS